MSLLGRALLAALVLAAGALGLLALVASRDDAEVGTPAAGGPGEAVPGECARGEPQILRDRRPLDGDRLAHALELGNVVVSGPDPRALAPLQRRVSGRFDAELALAGQMVIIARADGPGVVARAFGRRLESADPADPALAEFAEAWLGRGAGARCD